MNPKEKAKELYNKHYYIIKGLLNYPNGTTKYKAKQCALLCVDELIELYEFEVPHRGFKISYWDEVKQEIEKL